MADAYKLRWSDPTPSGVEFTVDEVIGRGTPEAWRRRMAEAGAETDLSEYVEARFNYCFTHEHYVAIRPNGSRAGMFNPAIIDALESEHYISWRCHRSAEAEPLLGVGDDYHFRVAAKEFLTDPDDPDDPYDPEPCNFTDWRVDAGQTITLSGKDYTLTTPKNPEVSCKFCYACGGKWETGPGYCDYASGHKFHKANDQYSFIVPKIVNPARTVCVRFEPHPTRLVSAWLVRCPYLIPWDEIKEKLAEGEK